MIRYRLLDAIRGFSMLWIVYLHTFSHRYILWPFFARIIERGYLAVGIFFVISGFGIAGAADRLRKGQGTLRDFVLKRLKRIYIPLWFSLFIAALVVPVGCAWLTQLKEALAHSAASVEMEFFSYSFFEWVGIFTLTKVFFIQNDNIISAFVPINIALWFLAVVVQMYAVVAAALINKKYYYWVLAGVTLLSILSYWPPMAQYFFRGTFLRSWPEFLFGVILYEVVKRGVRFPEGERVRRGLLVLSAAVMLGIVLSSVGRVWFALVFAFAAALCFPYDEKAAANRLMRFGTFIGTFSYSLLLLHIPLARLLKKFLHHVGPLPLAWADLLLTVPMVTVVSYGLYLVIEKPFSSAPRTSVSGVSIGDFGSSKSGGVSGA